MPTYQDLIGDVKGYWSPEDGDQLVGTVLQVGWDTNDVLAVDIQPENEAPLRVRIGDKFWRDWSKSSASRGDLVRITYRETPLMTTEAGALFDTNQKKTASYEIQVLGEEERQERITGTG